MKLIKTTKLGEIEYNENDIISFTNGLPGFEQENNFIIIKQDVEHSMGFLQSLKTPDLAFIIADPFAFFHDYEFDLDDLTKEELAIKDIEDVVIWGIVFATEDFKKSTINLKAPLIININKKKGKQLILSDDHNYITKMPLFPHLEEKGGK